MEFAGRSVVLTGVGREGQVGEAVAQAFAERGARVFLIDRLDTDARARAEALVARFAASGPVAESDPAIWQRQFAINATTAYLTARALLPLLRAGKGSIVFFASEAVLPDARAAELSAYVAAKSAVVGLMHAIAQEEISHGVRANAVAPTAIRTADNVASMGANAPMVTREAVADVVLWLCSDAARAVSGQVIPVR
jgi:NAD(P)-dependent dehydrogenase (short-subunit alcohol dehydrogenase family)